MKVKVYQIRESLCVRDGRVLHLCLYILQITRTFNFFFDKKKLVAEQWVEQKIKTKQLSLFFYNRSVCFGGLQNSKKCIKYIPLSLTQTCLDGLTTQVPRFLTHSRLCWCIKMNAERNKNFVNEITTFIRGVSPCPNKFLFGSTFFMSRALSYTSTWLILQH